MLRASNQEHERGLFGFGFKRLPSDGIVETEAQEQIEASKSANSHVVAEAVFDLLGATNNQLAGDATIVERLPVEFDAELVTRRDLSCGFVLPQANGLVAGSNPAGPTRSGGVPRQRRPLLFREARVGFYFIDLFGVALAVRRDKEHPLVGVEFLAERAVRRMLAQVWRLLEERDGLGTAFREMFQAILWGAEAVVRAKRFGCLRFFRAVGDGLEDKFVQGLDIVGVGTRRSFHDFVLDHVHDKIFGGRNMLRDFGHRPTVRARLEVPLGLRQAFSRLEDAGAGFFEVLERLGALFGGDILRSANRGQERRKA